MDFDEGGTSELHQFVVLAQSAKGAACAALIREVLSHPKIFVFGELLALPNVQELANTEHAPVLELLNTFAFGTWGSLTPVQASQLDESQASKLKKLTLVSMCASAQVIPYDTLMRDLGISSVRALEDLVISLIYEGLLQAKLDQRSKQIEVHHAIGRDVHPDELAQMEAKLRSWRETTVELMATLEAQVTDYKVEKDLSATRKSELNKRIETITERLKQGHGQELLGHLGAGSDGGFGCDVEMPLCEEGRLGGSRSGARGARTRGLGPGGGSGRRSQADAYR